MKASYKKLWKLLIDKEMSKGDLHEATGLSSSTMTKLRKSEDVSMEALRKICRTLDCNIGDIVEFERDTPNWKMLSNAKRSFYRYQGGWDACGVETVT